MTSLSRCRSRRRTVKLRFIDIHLGARKAATRFERRRRGSCWSYRAAIHATSGDTRNYMTGCRHSRRGIAAATSRKQQAEPRRRHGEPERQSSAPSTASGSRLSAECNRRIDGQFRRKRGRRANVRKEVPLSTSESNFLGCYDFVTSPRRTSLTWPLHSPLNGWVTQPERSCVGVTKPPLRL